MVMIKNWRGSFSSRDSKICCISIMNWAHFLHGFTNLWKLKVTIIIIGWVWSKMGEALKIVGLLNQVYLTNDLMNWADWLNDFCMLIEMECYSFALNDARMGYMKTVCLGKRVELFFLFVAFSFTSIEATVLSCLFSWVCSDIPKVLWSNKSPIS